VINQIDAGAYAESQTRSLKIPVPGNPGSEHYSRVDGEFEQDGQVFRLVKHRLYKDTFHIVFIKDEMGTLIKHAMADYAQSFSGKTHDDDAQQLIILPIFLREYLAKSDGLVPVPELIADVVKNSPTKIFIESFCKSIVHPPERADFPRA
jgi:hypothetical protein